MSSTNYYSKAHKFTSRSTEAILPDDVEIEAGSNENLYIRLLKTDQIFSTTTSDNFLQNGLDLEQTLSHLNTVSAALQGQTVKGVTTSNGDNYVAFSAYTYNTPSASTGGVAVFKNGIQNPTLLTDFGATGDQRPGYYLDMNPEADRIVFCDNLVSSKVNIYTRTGDVWTFRDEIMGLVYSKISGRYIVGATDTGTISIWYDTVGDATNYALVKTIGTGGATAIYATTTSIKFHSNNFLQQYILLNGIWLQIALPIEYTGTAINLVFNNDYTAFTTATELIIYDNLQKFTILPLSATPTGLDFTSDYIYVSNATEIQVFNKIVNTWTELPNATPLTGITCLSATENNLYAGKPNGGVYSYSRSNYVNSNVVKKYVDLLTVPDRVVIAPELEALEIYTNNIYGEIPRAFISNNLSDQTTYQYADTVNQRNQGQSVTISDNTAVSPAVNVWMAVGCPIPAGDGSVVAVKSTGTSPLFNLNEQILQNGLPTSDKLAGYYSSMSRDGSRIGYTERPLLTGNLSIYKRTGDTWTFEDYIATASAVNIKMDSVGNRFCTGELGGDFTVYLRTGAAWTPEQVLIAGGTDKTILSYTGAFTCCYSLGSVTYIYTSDGATWSLLQSIDVTDDVVDTYLFENTCVIASATDLYVYSRDSVLYTETYSIDGTIATTNTTTVVCCNESFVFTGSSVGLDCYRLSSYTKSGNTTTTPTAVVSIDCNDIYLVAGLPQDDGGNGTVKCFLIGPIPSDEIIANSITLGDDLNMTLESTYGNIVLNATSVVMADVVIDDLVINGTLGVLGATVLAGAAVLQSTLNVTGTGTFINDVVVGGRVNSEAIFTEISGTTAQSIPSALFPRTIMTTIFTAGTSFQSGETGFLSFNLTNGSITVLTNGVYTVQTYITYAANATGIRCIEPTLSGGPIDLITTAAIVVGGVGTTLSSTSIFALAAGAVITLGSCQDSGGALNVTAAKIRVLRNGAF